MSEQKPNPEEQQQKNIPTHLTSKEHMSVKRVFAQCMRLN